MVWKRFGNQGKREENKKKRRKIVKWSGTEKVSWIHMASEAGLSQISNSSGV